MEKIKVEGLNVRVLDKKDLDASFASALWRALGRPVYQANYAYVVGSTDDPQKALATATNVNKLLKDYKGNLTAKVWQPKGKEEYYVAVGELASPQTAANFAVGTREAAIHGLASVDSQESKQAAALMLKGQVVDARAMFSSKP